MTVLTLEIVALRFDIWDCQVLRLHLSALNLAVGALHCLVEGRMYSKCLQLREESSLGHPTIFKPENLSFWNVSLDFNNTRPMIRGLYDERPSYSMGIPEGPSKR
jgi:hypothetical protein